MVLIVGAIREGDAPGAVITILGGRPIIILEIAYI